MFNKISLFFFVFVLFVSISISGQEIGKIYSTQEANTKFGAVKESKSVPTADVLDWLNKTGNKIMFRLKNGSLTVLGDHRELVYSSSKYSENNELFHLYSKSKVSELIKNNTSRTTIFENRDDVFSITNGASTLEMSWPCPPKCD